MGFLGGAEGAVLVEDPEGCGKTEPRLRLRGRSGRRGFGVAVAVLGVTQGRVGGGVPVLDVRGPGTTDEDFGFGREWVRQRVRGDEVLGPRCAGSGVLCGA